MGRPLPPGRLPIVADQGCGDTVPFGRDLPQVLEHCPEPLATAGRDIHAVMRQCGPPRPGPGYGPVRTVSACRRP